MTYQPQVHDNQIKRKLTTTFSQSELKKQFRSTLLLPKENFGLLLPSEPRPSGLLGQEPTVKQQENTHFLQHVFPWLLLFDNYLPKGWNEMERIRRFRCRYFNRVSDYQRFIFFRPQARARAHARTHAHTHTHTHTRTHTRARTHAQHIVSKLLFLMFAVILRILI